MTSGSWQDISWPWDALDHKPISQLSLEVSAKLLFLCYPHTLPFYKSNLFHIQHTAGAWAIIQVSGHQYPCMASRWLWPGNKILLELASMVVIWWIVFFSTVQFFQFDGRHRCLAAGWYTPNLWKRWRHQPLAMGTVCLLNGSTQCVATWSL